MLQLGPNVKKLIIAKMSRDAVPSDGGIGDVIQYLVSGDLANKWRLAQTWVMQAIATVKSLTDNPYGDDDEAIAGEILRQVDIRLVQQQQRLEAPRVPETPEKQQ